MEKNILEYIGKSLYQTNILKEMKRYLVFRTRCRLHSSMVNDLLDFFAAVTVGDGVDGFPEKLAAFQHGMALAVPVPHINQVVRDHGGYLPDLQGNPADVLRLVFLRDFHNTVRNVEYNA